MLEGLGFSFLEPSHNLLPRAAARAGSKSARSSRKPRRVHSDSEALCSRISRAVSRRSDGNDGNDDDEADDLML